MEMEKLRDEAEVLKKGAEIKKLWRMGVDEDLTMEERRRRWRKIETARREREQED